MLVEVSPSKHRRLIHLYRCTTAFTVPTPRQLKRQIRVSSVLGLPPQLIGPYDTLSDALQNLQPVQWQTLDIVGARGNIRWLQAAFALFLVVLVIEALGRVTVGAVSDSEPGGERANIGIEKRIEDEVQQQPPVIELPLQLELEKNLRESEKNVADRESSITFAVIAWALFTFALEAFDRTPDLPLQP